MICGGDNDAPDIRQDRSKIDVSIINNTRQVGNSSLKKEDRTKKSK